MLAGRTVIRKSIAYTPLGELDDTWKALLANRTALADRAVPHLVNWLGFDDEAVFAALVAARALWKFQARELGERLSVQVATTKNFATDSRKLRPIWDKETELLGPHPIVISNACVSGAQALIHAVEAIQDGDVDAAGVVAGDSITGFVADGFDALQARSALPAKPFDRARDGLSLGETACGVLLLPETDDPRAASLPRVVAYGCSNDANHISGPSRDGSGLALAIERALVGIDRSEIRAICAHGTATVYNDAMEARAFHTVFGGNPPPVFGIKGAIGHTLGAAGLIEVIISALVASEGVIPPTVGFEQGEEDFPLDVVHGQPRKIKPGYVLTTNSGFGGMNTAIIIGPGNP